MAAPAVKPKTNTGGNPFLDAAYAAKSPAELREVYDKWATQYDKDVMGQQGYTAPLLSAQTLARHMKPAPGQKILDAGCGTGLVGSSLSAVGFGKVDGVDLSEGMLAEANKTGAYNALATADLTNPLAAADKSYDAVVCVGTLTQGHVGPEAFDDFVRVTKKGGWIVATVLGDIWEPRYRLAAEGLAKDGKVRLVSAEEKPYRPNLGVFARMVVLQVL